jgi:uncharacterized C2H2 Zn-finger protein
MARQKNIKCSKCDRRFSMQAHLARHMNTMHGTGGKKAKPARKGRKVRRRYMPRSAVAAFSPDFADFSLTQLCTLIDLARAEAKRRLEVM